MPTRHLARAVAALLLPGCLVAQTRAATPATPPANPWAALLLPTTHAPTPTTAAITAADLRTRLFAFAADSMMGRRTGTEGNVKGVDYIASEVKRFGLLPGGVDATYFQPVGVPIDLRTFDSTSTIAVAGTALVPWVPRPSPGGRSRQAGPARRLRAVASPGPADWRGLALPVSRRHLHSSSPALHQERSA